MTHLDIRSIIPPELRFNHSPAEIKKRFTQGLECVQDQRKVFNLDKKQLASNYRIEIGTRLCFAQFLQGEKDYEAATAEIGKAIQLAKEHEFEMEFEKLENLIARINELRDLALKEQTTSDH